MKNEQASAQAASDVTSSADAPELPTEKAFVLQLTRQTGLSLEPFAGRVEHVASGRRVQFRDFAGFRAAVTRLLAEAEQPEGEEPHQPMRGASGDRGVSAS